MADGKAKQWTLPEELIVEIASWLPADCIPRFQIVCKSWHSLFNHPQFVAKHLLNSFRLRDDPNFSTTILLKRLVEKDSGKKEIIISLLTYPFSDNQSVVNVDLNCFQNLQYIEIFGQSHGIVCLSDNRRDIVLCNPATREFHKLPPSILLETGPPNDEFHSCTNAMGFGYDPKSKDFKVVRVVYFVEAPGIFYPSKAEVYDLSKDRWRKIEAFVPGFVFWAPSFDMHYKGMYYWWALNHNTEIIQTFDISEEVFGTIPVPESFEQPFVNERSLGVLNESIVLFHYPYRGTNKHFDIWVMENDEFNGVSWSKLLRIGPVFEIERTILFVNSEELLMEVENGELIAYNVSTKEIKNLPVKGIPKWFQAAVFVQSLLSVKGGNQLDLGVAAGIM